MTPKNRKDELDVIGRSKEVSHIKNRNFLLHHLAFDSAYEVLTRVYPEILDKKRNETLFIMSSQIKKRIRHRKVCLACRRRKSKCNCERPVCSACKRRLTEHSCIYDDLYPFQKSLRVYQSEPVNPNFPSFNPIHLPQLIAVGSSMLESRDYNQRLSDFQRFKNPFHPQKTSSTITSEMALKTGQKKAQKKNNKESSESPNSYQKQETREDSEKDGKSKSEKKKQERQN